MPTDFISRKFACTILGLFLLAFVYLQFRHFSIGDFGNYYFASKFFAQGLLGNWLYEPIIFNLAVYDMGYRDFFLNYTPVPPLSLLVYVPFSFPEIFFAKLLWNLLNAFLFLFTVYRLAKKWNGSSLYLLAIIPCMFTALKS